MKEYENETVGERVQMINREKDMYLGNKDLELLYTMKDFPVYCGVTDQDVSDDRYEDMKWMISRGSGMIQLGELLPLDDLYSVSHNSSYGGIWRQHHDEFSDFLHKYVGKRGVLEIGGGNGILNSVYNVEFDCEGGVIPWTIIEPSLVNKATGCNAHYIKSMWDDDLDLGSLEYDTLVHSHLMEHQYDLNNLMNLNSRALGIGDRMIFSVPDLRNWLKMKYSNALFFEHTYLISEEYIDGILGKYGFGILEKYKFANGHSIFYATEKRGGFTENILDYRKIYIQNKNEFEDFVNHFKEKAAKYNALTSKYKEVYLFGAHIFSQMLLHFGLDMKNIKSILDNDTLKQGRRLYGTNLMVESPKVLIGLKSPVVILNAGAYTEEIKSDILDHINGKAIIIE